MNQPPKIDSTNTAVVIPARRASTRLPDKILADIGGKPMIIRVMEGVMAAGFGVGGGRLIVACDDKEVARIVTHHGGEAIMTDPHHPSGSDRVFEAIQKIDPDCQIHYIVNVQGDLPTIDGAILAPLAEALITSNADIATPFAPCLPEDSTLPQVVKAAIAFPQNEAVGVGSVGRVLYFSRAPIPYGSATHWHHIGIYAFRREALAAFTRLKPSPLEQAERLEQLRAIEHTMAITALVVDEAPKGVDTAEDLNAIRERFANQPIEPR